MRAMKRSSSVVALLSYVASSCERSPSYGAAAVSMFFGQPPLSAWYDSTAAAALAASSLLYQSGGLFKSCRADVDAASAVAVVQLRHAQHTATRMICLRFIRSSLFRNLVRRTRAVDQIPVEFHADSRFVRHVGHAALVDRISILHRKPERLFGHEQLKILAVANGAAHVQVGHVHEAHGCAMDLAAQAMRFGEVRDLERAGDAGFPRDVGANNIDRVHRDRLRHPPRPAARGLCAGDGD